jgi:integrase
MYSDVAFLLHEGSGLVARERRSFGRLRRLPSGRYQAAYVGPDGKVHTAKRTFGARDDAESWLSDRRKEIDRDLWNPGAAKAAKRKPSVTFGAYSDRWLQTRRVKGRALRPRTKAHYRRLLELHILPSFGSKPLRSITADMVDRWYEHTAVDTPTARAHCYSLLRAIFESACTGRDRLIEINPCLIDGAGTTDRVVKPKPASVEQLAVLVANMPDRLQLMVLLGAWCGLRFGEQVELRRADIDVLDGVVNVARGAVRTRGEWIIGDPKSAAGKRPVSIPPHLMPAVEKHLDHHVAPRPDALLFPPAANAPGAHLQPSTLYRHWYKARTAAGREDLRWHDLRHTGAVFAAQAGGTLAELMQRLGHSTPAAPLRYQHAAEGRDKLLAERLSRIALSENGNDR